MAPQSYDGPASLAYSRYASPTMKRAQPVTVPPVVSPTGAFANSTIATKEQIAASLDESAAALGMATRNSDAQLAVVQGNALKEEVEKHTTKFSRTVSSTVTTTRRLLGIIQEAVQKEDASALKTVDDLWIELEQLFDAANGTKEALPEFLEKQRNNMALYHASAMNETYRDSQAELNMQYKKVNLQHSLILEHQQAFQEHKVKTATKLAELEDLQERMSRLTLEKGNFRDEIDRYAQLLEKDQATRADDLKKAEALHEELKTLASSKKQLLAEADSMQKTITELQDKSQSTKKQISDCFSAEVKEKADLLAKETVKTANLSTLINNLEGQETSAKTEIDRVKAESKLLNEKYNRMATEHSQTFSVRVRHEYLIVCEANSMGRRSKSMLNSLRV
jgi:DNA repair exonuclease SbcCD ATPase subunit